MSQRPLIVLKFGGSILLNEDSLRAAVHEIERWRGDGWSTVAVVSAFAGRTDDLLNRGTRLSPSATPSALAGVIATGELESAAFFGLHLDRAGIASCVLSPGLARLRATGPELDANPIALDAGVFQRAFARDEIVAFPGFVAVDESGRHVTLGRGGSDLTALFLAHGLGAIGCRLIKDVDGLYEFDPARSGPTPRRYAYCSFDDALQTDGTIVQHKAVRLAQRLDLEFELGRLGSQNPTVIGGGDSRFDDASRTGADQPKARVQYA